MHVTLVSFRSHDYYPRNERREKEFFRVAPASVVVCNVICHSSWNCQWSWSPLAKGIMKPGVADEQLDFRSLNGCSESPAAYLYWHTPTDNTAPAGLFAVQCLPITKSQRNAPLCLACLYVLMLCVLATNEKDRKVDLAL